MPYPARLGDPCWDPAQVGKVITVNAQTSAASVDYFLAAHSPFRFISNASQINAEVTEEQVYEDIFSSGRREVQAAIRGEPGTGKSHLVHWLKLRADQAATDGDKRLAKFVRVLVQRGNGSLKDALEQIVSQLVAELGPDFRKHLERVQNALEKLSETTARAKLLAELTLEIENRWTERGRPPLAPGIALLGEALRANGVRNHLLRAGGTIDQVVRILTEASSLEQRENEYVFGAADLPESIGLLPRENSRQVTNFFEDLEMEEDKRDAVLDALNRALPDAIGELTGLTGANLMQIFQEIRRELAGRKRELAIFIEDVSVTAAGLDRDVINALEPQERNGQCRMVAVLGMTTNAWSRLAKNQQDRIRPVYEVGAGVTTRWAGDEAEVARFTARYLNAIRADDEQMRELARSRRQGDVPKSLCDPCPRREECFATFGHATLGNGVEIGTFPFTHRAPQALLNRHGASDAAVESTPTQRELLGAILQPILDDAKDSLRQHEFPRSQFMRVRPVPVTAWPPLENRFLGGWDPAAKERVRWLAQFWVEPGDADELAAALKPFLKPLGLPEITEATRAARKRDTSPGTTVTPPPVTVQKDDPQLTKRRGQIDDWFGGQDLQPSNYFRDLVAGLINKGIRWEDERTVSHEQYNSLVASGSAFPRIEGQAERNANQAFFFDLPRDAETRDLLIALVQFARAGDGKTWDFKDGELYKRTVSHWLRKHRPRVVAAVQPPPTIEVQAGVRVAAQVLALAARWRERKALAPEMSERFTQIFGPEWTEATRPATLSTKLGETARDLERRHVDLRNFLVRELGAGQGRFKPKNFIDPLPVIKALRETESLASVAPLPENYQEGTAKTRFADVSRLGAYVDLDQRLEAERSELAARLDEIRQMLGEHGCQSADLHDALTAWLPMFIEVINLQRGFRNKPAALELRTQAFEDWWLKGVFRQRGETWTNNLRKAAATVAGESTKVLEFDPAVVKEATEALRAAREHLQRVEKQLTEQETDLAAKGAGGCDDLLAELAAFPTGQVPAPPGTFSAVGE